MMKRRVGLLCAVTWLSVSRTGATAKVRPLHRGVCAGAACHVTWCSTTLTRPPPIGVMVKRRAVGQGTDGTVSRRAALSEWRRWVTVLSSRILA